MHPPHNIFAGLPTAFAEEQFQTILQAAGFRVERIVSRGHASPEGFWYEPNEDEWVLLLAGAARLRFEGDVEAMELTVGSYVRIAAGQRHRVEWTDPTQVTVWLAIHYPAAGLT